MGPISRFAARHQIWFVLASVAAWLVLLVVFMGLASSALGRPYGDRVSGAAARLTLAACVVAFVWRLGWLRTCGIARLGDGRVWLLAAAGLVYSAGAFLYAFYGTLAFDASIVIRLPAARTAAWAALITALGEEVLFRGLALHALARAWGRTRAGLLASVVLAALLFAALHGIQVLTNDLPRSAALLLILQALVVSIWWGALVVAGGSLWPAVLLHFVVNAVAAVQGLAASPIEPALLAYQRSLWLSIPLGLAGIGLLTRVARRPAPVTAA